jgi:2-octaprenyl-6-methoxyphenol hydroxylase
MEPPGANRFDIVICGGSFAGLALARALICMAPGNYSIAIVERRPLDAQTSTGDTRSVALTAAAKAMLDVIGIWPALADKAEPVLSIELTDSELGAPFRPSLIALDCRETESGEPTAYIVENAVLLQALLASLRGAAGLAFFSPQDVADLEIRDESMNVRLGSGEVIDAKLLVAADGQASKLRELAGIRAVEWPSQKVGIVATAGIERPHEGIAHQHFLPAGPFAVLPMTENRVSIVWTEDTATAKKILAEDLTAIASSLLQRLGTGLGELTLLSKPKAYPLTMTFAREFVRPRFALIGDAAHGLHWIAGQGLNHGMKDVAALTETLIGATRLGLDIGSLGVLKRYERWRRFDSAASAFSAAAIDTVFSNDNVALRMLRSSALRGAGRFSGLKALLMREAAGLTGEVPKLLKGEPV